MAFNSEKFIRESIEAAFSQTYEPLEIVLSDDCSTDQTFEILKTTASEYHGPHKIILNRNEKNVGVSGHINRVMEICSGQIVVIAAADDISDPNRVQKTYEAFVESGQKALSIHSSCILIDETGEETGIAQDYEKYETDLESVIDNGTWLYGCTHAWHRLVFDKFGPLPLEVRREDEVIPFRSLLLGTISYIREPLVRYRSHAGNISKANRRLASNKRDLQDHIAYRYYERLVNLKCYLSDLETAGDNIDSERWETIKKRLVKEIRECELEMSIRKGRTKEKLFALSREITNKFDPALTVKLLFRILCPDAYTDYCFKKHKREGSQRQQCETDSAALGDPSKERQWTNHGLQH